MTPATTAVERGPVLIVDDRADNRTALRAILEPLSVPLVEAASGDEALRYLLAHECTLILLDVDMPQMNGFQTAALVKERPRTSDIPVIFLTAYDSVLDHANEGYSFGAVDYITKPYDPSILRAKVRVFIELQDKSVLLERQARQLEQHVDQLRLSRRALSDAQRIANLGSWEYEPQTGRVRGSRQFHQIFGVPPDDPLPPAEDLFDRLEFLPDHVPGSVLLHATTKNNFEGELRQRDDRRRSVVVHVEPRADTLTLVGTIQDVTEQREAQVALDEVMRTLEREREIVQVFQQAVAAPTAACDPGVSISYCYRPAESAVAGGDWYDVFALPSGELLLAIGDVAGHGLSAASMMSDIRTALRTMSIRESSPSALIAELNKYVRMFHKECYATMLVVRLDQTTGRCVAASAGHPPAVRFVRGRVEFEWMRPGPPLGTSDVRRSDESFKLQHGESLVMYTDGLVERRAEALDSGLSRLEKLLKTLDPKLPDLANEVVGCMRDTDWLDDVAVLAVHYAGLEPRLHITRPAQPSEIAPLRAVMRHWFDAFGVDAATVENMVIAVSEVAANVCTHAYRPGVSGSVLVDAIMNDEDMEIVVRDNGAWRETRNDDRGGRGLRMVRALVPDTTIEPSSEGTTVRLRAPRTGSL